GYTTRVSKPGFFSWITVAADVSVQATLSDTAVYLGDSVVLEVRINGVRDPELPDLSLPNVEVTSEGGQSFSNSSISITNGRRSITENFGYTARYQLRPRQAGVFTIPAITIEHAGQTYSSRPLQLNVQAPEAQDYLLVDVTTDKPSYVLGERVTVRLDVSIRKLVVDGNFLNADPFFPNEPPHAQIPWFADLGDWKTSNLETFVQPFLNQQRAGFYINDYVDQRSFFGRDRLKFTLPRQTTQQVRPSGTYTYFTYRLEKTFRPIRAGTQIVAAVLVKANLPTLVDNRGRARRTERVIASSEPLSITVQAVPSANQPNSFSGGVGEFKLTAKANPTKLKVGDPFTVTLTVQGNPDSLLETVRAPQLDQQPDLVKDFKIHTDPPAVNTLDDTTKTFTYTLRPRHADVRAVPPIDMAYYNPVARQFRTAQSHAIPLNVEPSATLSASDVVVTDTSKPKSRLGRQLADGLLANYTGPEVLVPQQSRLQFTPLLGAFLIVPPLAYMFACLGQYWQRKRHAHPERQRSKRAARTALASLDTLDQQADANNGTLYAGVQQALTGYIRDKLDLNNAGLTVDDIAHHLRAQGVDDDLIHQTSNLFHLCDNARYAPGGLAVTQHTDLLGDAKTLVQRLEATPLGQRTED
uniref:BatD family protein n=1 Tax=Candidatus Entotheonella palauensis TaxID=93172 RepID=UPI0011773EC8